MQRWRGGARSTGNAPGVPFCRALLGAVLLSVAIGGCGSSAPALTGNRVVLVYRAHAGAEPVSTASINAAIGIVRKRVAALGLPSEIRHSGADEITVALADAGSLAPGDELVGKTAQLDFYDWEPNVIGAAGKPAPSDATVTGGPNAGAVQFGLTEYQAVLRAAKRAAIVRPNDTTLSPGCTPAQIGGCRYGVWYLLDTKHQKMLCPDGEPICGPVDTKAELYADHYRPPAGAKLKVVHVNPGTVLVQAHPEESDNRILKSAPNSFYVLNDDPAMNGEDINNPRQGLFNPQQGCCLYEGEGTGQPDVVFDFTAHGKTAFEQVTKEVAHRGQEARIPGVTKEDALQHFAIVLDNQIITAPSIDFTMYPEGIDVTNGSEISGRFTISSARDLANELRFGALPINLELVSRSRVPAG
jgi:SecD/SecF fusion protein